MKLVFRKEVFKMKLKNKIAFVTGASSGIGQAASISLAKEGVDLFITYRNNKEGALETKQIINELGRKCEIYQANFENMDEVSSAMTNFLNKFNGLDILINNAGDARYVDVFNENIDNFDYIMNVNVKSAFLLSILSIKEMLKRGGGNIVNISSISGINVNEEKLISYCTSKAALNMLTRTMAKDLAEKNIRVNALLPGIVETRAARIVCTDEDIERMIKKVPMKIISNPEDIAGMIVFLCTDAARFMTGSLIVMDGGQTL